MKYLILGGVQSVLPILRSLAREGAEVYIACLSDDVASKSRYGEKIISSNYDGTQIEVHKLLSKYCDDNFFCIVGSEAYVSMVSKLQEYRNLTLFTVDYTLLSELSDKFSAYKKAEAHGVKVLPYCPIVDEEIHDLEYPVIVKCATFVNDDYIDKTRVINSKLELDNYKGNIPHELFKHLIVQKYVANFQSYSFGSIWLDGELVDSTVVMQERQYPKGITSSVKLADEEIANEVTNLVSDYFSCDKLNGFIEVEFILSNEELFLIDINPRVWGWSAQLFREYKLRWIEVFAGEVTSNEKEKSNWINVFRDVPAVLNSSSNCYEKTKAIYSYFSNNTKLQALDLLDPLPELYGLIK